MNNRTNNWAEGIRSFELHPLLGVGGNMYRTVNTWDKVAHNSFLSVLVELGFVGLILFLLMLAMAYGAAFVQKRLRDRVFWLTLLLVWTIGRLHPHLGISQDHLGVPHSGGGQRGHQQGGRSPQGRGRSSGPRSLHSLRSRTQGYAQTRNPRRVERISMEAMQNSNKRVAIFMPGLYGGGGERSMLNLAHGMANSGYEVDLVLARKEGPFLEQVRPSLRIVDLKASRVFAALPALVRYLRRERPAAMLSVFGYANIVASSAWRLAGVPTRLLLNEQNTVSREVKSAARWRGRMVPHLIRYFYPWADGIVVVSNGVADDMAQLTRIPRERITVIYNPSVVKAEVWEKAQAPLDDPWFHPGGAPVLLAVGRLQVQKDFPTLLQAFARLRASQTGAADHPGGRPRAAAAGGAHHRAGLAGGCAPARFRLQPLCLHVAGLAVRAFLPV